MAEAVSAGVHDAARRIAPVFSGSSLRSLRYLLGMTLAEFAAESGVSASALNQAELGRTKLSIKNIALVSSVFGVSPEALASRADQDVSLPPRLLPTGAWVARERSKARRPASELVRGAARIVRVLRDAVEMPPLFGFEYPVNLSERAQSVDGHIEEAATATRDALNVAQEEALGETLLAALEAGGVVAVLGHSMPAWVNTYSAVVDGVPLLVIRDMRGWTSAHTNLAVASALGRVVMHQRTVGAASGRAADVQANRFAHAFLAPAAAIRQELPPRLDWDAYFALKARWGIPLDALLTRAKDLRVIDSATHAEAKRHMEAQMWTLVDSHSRTLPMIGPSLLSRALDASSLSMARLAERSHLPEGITAGIVGATEPPSVCEPSVGPDECRSPVLDASEERWP